MKNTIAILGIDNFSAKNVRQVNLMNSKGYIFDVFTNDSLGTSKSYIPDGNKYFKLEKGIMKRMCQLSKYFFLNHKNIHHAEIYVPGKFCLFYILISKIFFSKSIVIERGDVGFLKIYDKLTRISTILCYRYSTLVLYKEPHMEELLKKVGVKRMIFLHNCTNINVPFSHDINSKDIDFLWVNRFVEQRKIEWIIDAIEDGCFKKCKFAFLGKMSSSNSKKVIQNQERLEKLARNNKNVLLEGYIEPWEYYLRAKFFLFPSDLIFGNNALNESMAYGVVPLVSDVRFSNLIIEDQVNGFLIPHNKNSFLEWMGRVMKIEENEYVALSKQARKKMEIDFNDIIWSEKLHEVYKEID